MNNNIMDLKFFFESEKDFFTNAFNEAYNIGGEEDNSNAPSEPVEPPENVSEGKQVEEPATEVETPPEPYKEQIKEMYEKYYGKPEETPQKEEEPQEPQYDEETQNAIELYQYLMNNPELVEAMRGVDVTKHEELQQYVPDEIHQKLNALEDYVQEQKYQQYISDLKNKFDDFDEDKVLEYAEKHEVYDLEVAYKALKSEENKAPDLEELKKQIREEMKKELLEELKQNNEGTNSIIGGGSVAPDSSDEVKLTAKEERIAKAMGMTPAEYNKWR